MHMNHTKLQQADLHRELDEGMGYLEKVFYVDTKEVNLPVAFATNAMNVMERNGAHNAKVYEETLIPPVSKRFLFSLTKKLCG